MIIDISQLKKTDTYAFISYAHTESVKVTSVLRLLDRHGIRFWYDNEIEGGNDWHREIRDWFQHSSMFVCFLSNGVEQRPIVLEEIRMAIKRHEADSSYHVLFIFMEKMPPRVFSDCGYADVEEFINKMQHFRYEGITEQFLRKLFAKNVFPDKLVKPEYLENWQIRSEKDYGLEIEEAFIENSYICETIFPEKREDESFYRVRLNQIAPDAVCLICLDNQWCPTTFFDDPEFWKRGFLSKSIRERQTEYQRKEIFRALLHNRQLITNRAFFYNSGVLGEWYDPSDDDSEAFRQLLANGSLLVFLTTENAPYDEKKRPKFATNFYDVWGAICREQEVYCLRMDWTDEATNDLKVKQLLYSRFQNFCLTMSENKHLLDELATVFRFTDKQKKDFFRTWTDVQLHVAARDRDEKESYTREQFYQKFIVKKGADVSDGILDIDKPFASELKEIADFQYGLNLPDALGARAIYPTVGHLKEFYRTTDRLRHNTREISYDELTCAIGQFVPKFLKSEVFFPNNSGMQLSEVARMREMPEWKSYIRAIENGNKRANLQEVDYYDISFVWERYYTWLESARNQQNSVLGRAAWEKESGAVSILYHLGNSEIITVYSGTGAPIRIRADLGLYPEVPSDQDHTVLLTIDYVCADVLRHPIEDTPILAELRLFEGITTEKLTTVYQKILQRLLKRPFEWIPYEREREAKEYYARKSESPEWRRRVEMLQEDEDTYAFEKYLREKKNSDEWIRYDELMKKRPEQFIQNEMLQIETDLHKICEYERANKKTIGVRYHNEPFSMMVVDLVRGSDGKYFTYERSMPCVPRGAVVCVTVWDGKYVLLRQFRHSLRGYQISFPRGYGEKGVTAENNAALEAGQELGAPVLSVRYLGEVVADSGLSGGRVAVYYCEIEKPVLKKGYEGILQLIICTEEELQQMITNGEINDGFTLSALKLLGSQSN